jgi:ABC-type glycerol-3-phosphate transport system permease component
MLWAYFALSQFLIVWSANLPEEIPWYLRRLRGGWEWIALGLVVFHFTLPFALLLSRSLKRRKRTLAAVALALLAARFADMFWMIAPAFEPRVALHWLDVTAVVAIGGLWLALFVRHLASAPVVPLRDPALALEA